MSKIKLTKQSESLILQDSTDEESTKPDGEDDEDSDYKKAVIFKNIQLFMGSLSLLATKFLYIRNPEMQVCQFIFMRVLITCIILIIHLNKKIPYILGEPCRKG